MSRGGLGRNEPCPCGSGKKYKKCCYPRTFPDFSKPNAGLPDPFEDREAAYRALARQEAQRPRDKNVTIDTVEVGRTRLLCAPLAPYGDGDALPGTLAPPTPLEVETKYQEIRDGNPEGATEVVVEYTYPDLFDFAEVRAVFDADDSFQLVDGRAGRVLDLFRGMQVQLSRSRVGTIRGHPQRRYDIPVAPLPDKNGLWSSRIIGLVKHTAHEVVEFRWGGQVVRVTPGHVVWSADRRGWVGAHELLPGELIRVAGNRVAPVEGVRRVPGFIEVFGIEVEYFHNYFVGSGANAMLVHNGPEKVARPLQATAGMSLSPSGARSASPALGEAELRALAGDVNKSKDAAVIFATDPNPVVRQKALDILAEAERRTGLPTNAVTGFHEKSGTTVLVFRDPATATRAEVLEELRHLDWARAGNWNKDVPGVFTAFELRELDAAAHFRNLLAQGKITQAEFDETIRYLAHHLSSPGKPVTEAQARSLLERLTQ